MKRFTNLFLAVDRTTRTTEKSAALRAYFEEAPPEDAAWALAVLTGNKLIRRLSYKRLRSWAGEATGYGDWLLSECHSSVGDLSETLALILPPPRRPVDDEPLHRVIEDRILPLPQTSEAKQRRLVLDAWDAFGGTQRFLFHKLISGNFRFGAAKKVVANALADAAGVDPAVMQHRLAGRYTPSVANFRKLVATEAEGAAASGGRGDAAKPYPFFLAHQVETGKTIEEQLGDVRGWRAEWKWDGIRAQLIRRAGRTVLWSRGDEVINDAFPELVAAGALLPEGTVLDGEVLAWDAVVEKPRSFAALQKRLNRKRVEPTLFGMNEVVFMAYDALERGGEDLRPRTTDERREALAMLLPGDETFRLSPRVEAASWDALASLREESRRRGVEGLMLKKADAAYGTGRTGKGSWWKWKVDPYTVDCVMIYAQRGTGRRATLYTDYTFAVWDGERRGQGKLVPVTKAYSGLTDAEFAEVDKFIKEHSTGKKGAFREVEPEQVFEIAFEGIARSNRHRSGVALRFPRMNRWRTDKRPEEADTLADLERLIGDAGA
ncbi:MAG: ATP-dependent DNA ligase [Planctomycetota bacterium]